MTSTLIVKLNSVITPCFFKNNTIMNKIHEKVIVVTGGAQGIGFNIASKFLQNGAKITIILDVNEDEGVKAVDVLTNIHGKDKAVFIKCDVTEDLDRVSKTILKQYKHIEILVNSAGVFNEQNWKSCIDINLKSLIGCAYRFMEHMRSDQGGKGGVIINLSSIFGYCILPHGPTYNATKFGVIGFTKSLGHKENFDMTGVKVIAICPGFTSTGFAVGKVPWDLELKDSLSELISKRVFQNADVVSDAAVFVVNQAASGTVWEINEGKPITEVI